MKRRIRTATGKCDFTREYTYDEEGNIATVKQGDETETYTSAQGGKACDVVGQCFIAGTLVLCMDEKGNQCHKPIEEVKVGDMVWAYDEGTGESDWKPVVRLFRNETKEWYHIFVNGEEIVCTGGHPFYVVGEGFVEAKDLKISDQLLLSSGKRVIIEEVQVEQLSEPETTYNFEVADFHTYYVAESNVLVHNDCVKTTVHGKAHGSSEHQARIMQEVKKMQASGKYSDIYLNKALKTVGLNGTQRPDIIGKLIDGTFDAIEVASKTQVSTSLIGKQLAAKVTLMQMNNPEVYFHPIIWLFG